MVRTSLQTGGVFDHRHQAFVEPAKQTGDQLVLLLETDEHRCEVLLRVLEFAEHHVVLQEVMIGDDDQ
ncbi:hypothetical protein [Streptomyces sp. NPDC005336]|uniref:hypothetical protein n=1 Tax=Streptomyces sp. NPDC005336 TaxID=3157035 RepID=UPI0033B42CCB